MNHDLSWRADLRVCPRLLRGVRSRNRVFRKNPVSKRVALAGRGRIEIRRWDAKPDQSGCRRRRPRRVRQPGSDAIGCRRRPSRLPDPYDLSRYAAVCRGAATAKTTIFCRTPFSLRCLALCGVGECRLKRVRQPGSDAIGCRPRHSRLPAPYPLALDLSTTVDTSQAITNYELRITN